MTLDGWASVPLGDVAVEDSDEVVVEPDRQYPIAGVRIAGLGLFERQTLAGADTQYAKLYRLAAGQLVYRKLTAWEGPITVVPGDFDGAFVSSEFPTFRLDRERLEPAYLELLCRQPFFHAAMRRGVTGTAERRGRLKPCDLLSIPIALPPMYEQRRIVAVCDEARSYRGTCDAEHAAAFVVLDAAWQRQWDQLDAEGIEHLPLGSRCEIVVGSTPSRRRPDYWEPAHLPWLKTGEVRFNEVFDTSEKISATAYAESSAKLLPPGTCVMAMYGQGATRGRVAVTGVPLTANQACAAFLESSAIAPRYLFHWFWSHYRHTRELGEGTSQPNLNLGLLRSLGVPLPEKARQEDVVRVLDPFLELHRASVETAEAAATVEMMLAGRLLTGGSR